jgi:serine/threonine protein kinase
VAVLLDHVLLDEGAPDERLALISQFVTGTHLDELPAAADEDLCRLGRSLATTVAALHAGGVVHGDIKPGNVIVRSADAQPILIDAGSARHAGQRLLASSRLWEPPEAGDDPIATTAYDCWSLGLVLAALGGFRPTAEESPDARGLRACRETGAPLDRAVGALLRVEPARASAAEAATMLDVRAPRRRWRLR